MVRPINPHSYEPFKSHPEMLLTHGVSIVSLVVLVLLLGQSKAIPIGERTTLNFNYTYISTEQRHSPTGEENPLLRISSMERSNECSLPRL